MFGEPDDKDHCDCTYGTACRYHKEEQLREEQEKAGWKTSQRKRQSYDTYEEPVRPMKTSKTATKPVKQSKWPQWDPTNNCATLPLAATVWNAKELVAHPTVLKYPYEVEEPERFKTMMATLNSAPIQERNYIREAGAQYQNFPFRKNQYRYYDWVDDGYDNSIYVQENDEY